MIGIIKRIRVFFKKKKKYPLSLKELERRRDLPNIFDFAFGNASKKLHEYHKKYHKL